MKIKIRCSLLAILLLGSSTMVFAGNGIKRSEWSLRTELSTSNIIYGAVGMVGTAGLGGVLMNKGGFEELPWWFPTIIVRTPQLDTSSTYKENLFNFGFPCYSIGEALTYMSKELPIGFWAKVAYERQKFTGKEEKYPTVSKQMLVPELGLKIRFGKYRTAETIFTLDIGASYDYIIDAKGPYGGKDFLNQGFSGIIGFSYGAPDQHFQFGINASIPFYKFYNKGFTPDNGLTMPFEKFNMKSFIISEYIRFGF